MRLVNLLSSNISLPNIKVKFFGISRVYCVDLVYSVK